MSAHRSQLSTKKSAKATDLSVAPPVSSAATTNFKHGSKSAPAGTVTTMAMTHCSVTVTTPGPLAHMFESTQLQLLALTLNP